MGIVLALAATWAGYFAVTSPAFRPHGIAVRGNRVVARDQIIAKAAVAPNRNLWLQSAGAMAARVESIPYVERAMIHRTFGATVTIEVTERAPYAVLDSGSAHALLDRDLRVLEVPAPGGMRLPHLVLHGSPRSFVPGAYVNDAAVRRLRADEEALIAAHIDARTLETDRFGQLVVTLADGIRLLMGDDDDIARKLPLVNPILAQIARSGKALLALDLRAPSTPIAVYRR